MPQKMNFKHTLLFITLLASSGCATQKAINGVSDVYDKPIEQVISHSEWSGGVSEVCVKGELYNNGYGEYQITVPQRTLAGVCRNIEEVNGELKCTKLLPIVILEKEYISFGCSGTKNPEEEKYHVEFSHQEERTIEVTQKLTGEEVEQIRVSTLVDVNPLAYLFVPFTLIFDIITSPFQLYGELGGGK